MRSSRSRSILQIAIIAGVTLTVRASFADHYRVPSGSMEPTVHVGDRIVVSKAAYGLRVPETDSYALHFSAPARGDVVVLLPPEGDVYDNVVDDAAGTVLLKRVVAIGGDLVEVRSGIVFIDGKRVDTHASLAEGGGPDFGPARVPAGKILVLGDNRGNSRDGRFFGFVDRDRVVGRAFAVVMRDGKFEYAPL